MLSKLTIKEFLEKIALESPTPGGGSVAALSASLAASLTEMVANLTIEKKGYGDVEEEMKVVAQDAFQLRSKLVSAIDKDSNAYNDVVTATKLPGDTEAEKRYREEMIQRSLKQATLVPMTVAEDAIRVMELAGKTVAKGNKNTISDGAVGIMVARTAVLSALYNVKINLRAIKDKAFIDKISKQVKELEQSALQKEKELLSNINL
ncbi:MAG: cyclodeaminase/cyclohydrolase family protein [Candidatus Scalindua sp.]|jgi:formiminotetrahydrofolate cyclodeaminase|nr:cyclodeaminase/cyclohydrolase family protein [Candidatus Scalindua sp.]MBT5306765.1 cyclodeaminase/cyclohydrolase family protein [Candidatus Scalindua sp.]MBT6049789.1 cyclodeaminase/cyclohydrolase family protein [Candidatus Scalindua sp.]MBT6228440.1 cyclodeaminase/cyclohydrolase family protein [Candidatus Scalindua sp.]MBT6562948.1 cyclodeaminase/cyclohydrolase family protein [Candidatus Scalindua sp.]